MKQPKDLPGLSSGHRGLGLLGDEDEDAADRTRRLPRTGCARRRQVNAWRFWRSGEISKLFQLRPIASSSHLGFAARRSAL
jgi:hypothetical protein